MSQPLLDPARPASPDEFSALEDIARTLTASGDYRVVRRFRRRQRYAEPGDATPKRAVFLDVETTGRDHRTDAIIELAMVPFTFDRTDGRVFDVGEAASFLEDPGRPIPPEITELTGITDEMVRGMRIDDDRVAAMLSDTDLVIAHNAAFDRPFAERRIPAFTSKPWGCSLKEVPWEKHGCGSGKLEFILYQSCGEFFGAHRAAEDCYAGVHVLATPTRTGVRPLAVLLEAARTKTNRVWAIGSPFASKELLRERGYRWHGGEDGRPRSWYIDVPEDRAEEECGWLAREVYKGRQAPIQRDVHSAFTRYSGRV